MSEKVCGSCGDTKPLREFNKRARSTDGYDRTCRACANAYRNRWRRTRQTEPCVVTGCDRSTDSRRMCPTHYSRWRIHGDPLQGPVVLPVGHRTTTGQGYVHVKVGPDYKGRTWGKGMWAGEHIMVMERQLGRLLRKGESVHHKNGDRADNQPENLELWVGPIRSNVRANDLKCPHCGATYL